jgi:hypothetical protein
MIPATAKRVEEHTASPINEKINLEIEARIYEFSGNDPVAIEERLEELDREWDVERMLQTNFALVSLCGLALSRLSPKWLLLTAGAAGFMVQHALQGWCPPLAVFRRLGIRTYNEIDRERFALKALRGDFKQEQAI